MRYLPEDGIPCSTKTYSYRSFGRHGEICFDSFATTGLIWIPCSRCRNVQWAKWLSFQSKTSPVRQSGSGGAGLGCGLGHVWGEIRNGMFLWVTPTIGV
jgi:hypothetical protein